MKTNRMLDLNTLRSVVVIAEQGSMTRAAARLNMTQSAISMQIKRLENTLDLVVFDRSKQGITPTATGEQLLHYARQMLDLNDEALSRLTAKEFEGQVSLGVPPDIINSVIPQVLRRFSRDYPRVKIQLASDLSRHLLDDFAKGQHDIVLTTEQASRKGGEALCTQALVWTGAVGGNVWKNKPLPIGFSKDCAFRPIAIEALDKAGIDWHDVVVAKDEIAGRLTQAADLCIGAELESTAVIGSEPVPHEGALPSLPDHSIIMYRDKSVLGTPSAALADYLIEAYALQ